MNECQYDVAVVGAGIVGVTTALVCAARGYRVGLIGPPAIADAPVQNYDLRTYALTPASMRLFDGLGVRSHLDSSRVAPFLSMRVWDASGAGRIVFDPISLGRRHLAELVEHHALYRALAICGRGHANITWVEDSVADVRPASTVIELETHGRRTLRAAVTVACDGADSRVRNALNIVAEHAAFQQSAVVCNVTVDRPHEFIARQCFLHSGPLAFLPLPDEKQCAIVWSTTNEMAAALVGGTDQHFIAALENAFRGDLAPLSVRSERRSFPLLSMHAARYVHDRCVLLGDAAHVVHPLAGQGLNLGLMDAAALGESLGERNPSTLEFPRRALCRYERMRRGENLLMVKSTAAINAMFRHQHAWLVRLRGVGMCGVEHSGALKSWLILRAMGEVGDVPDLGGLSDRAAY